MKILVDIGHPAQLHFFRMFIKIMAEKGHVILITAKQKDELVSLLNSYKLEYRIIGNLDKRKLLKIFSLFSISINLFKIARIFRPDIIIGSGSVNAAHISALIKKPCILFDDTEHTKIDQMLYLPFVSLICTPVSFSKKLGKKHLKYNSCDELAYLHPKYFSPESSYLIDLGMDVNEKFIIVRLNKWGALHDRGQRGFSFANDDDLLLFIHELEKYGRVFISSEVTLSPELKKYLIQTSPDKMHDLLSFASLYVGEGATIAAEAAVLGTPSIWVSSLSLGYINELRDKYDLVHTCLGHENALKESQFLLSQPNVKLSWQQKKDKLLKEKIDITEYMINLVENYPSNKRS